MSGRLPDLGSMGETAYSAVDDRDGVRLYSCENYGDDPADLTVEDVRVLHAWLGKWLDLHG